MVDFADIAAPKGCGTGADPVMHALITGLARKYRGSLVSNGELPRSTSLNMDTSQERFTALVQAWTADLYRFAYWLARDRQRAEDLVQETFLRAWRSLAQLRDDQAAKSWLFTILRNEYHRRPATANLAGEFPHEELADNCDATQDWVVRRHILALDEEYREPLMLQVLGGLGCDEIATMLGISRAAVMTRLFRARQKLRAALAGKPATGNTAKDHNELS